ncbi:unnamed protein product [Polarella glacialis]|uniref:Uncharacterized protein n=1 Tax=Polarella glacialis TaxID=89957 RepID=A0A813FGF7_POLGL|nr:unnamed protein product [Polarella glacialis]CAE8638641.1 unnamed protein product [Polarella glacialis]
MEEAGQEAWEAPEQEQMKPHQPSCPQKVCASCLSCGLDGFLCGDNACLLRCCLVRCPDSCAVCFGVCTCLTCCTGWSKWAHFVHVKLGAHDSKGSPQFMIN